MNKYTLTAIIILHISLCTMSDPEPHLSRTPAAVAGGADSRQLDIGGHTVQILKDIGYTENVSMIFFIISHRSACNYFCGQLNNVHVTTCYFIDHLQVIEI